MTDLGPLRGVCVYCHLELYGDADPPARIRQHLYECPRHPMREVEKHNVLMLAACKAGLLKIQQLCQELGRQTDADAQILADAIAEAHGAD